MPHIDGVKSYQGVRRRAGVFHIAGEKLLAASREDITRGSAALKQKSDRALTALIRYRLSLPPEKRLNCLRRKIGLRATCL
jgi:hypothetical protein